MLSTGAMIRIGKSYHNYMVDVGLLNGKLYDRGCHIVSEIAGISLDEAQNLISQTNNVKAACVMACKKCDSETAFKLLAENGGILRRIIGD